MKNLKSKKKKPRFIISVDKCGWVIDENFLAWTNQDSTISNTRENQKAFNITSKYFSFLNIAHLQAEL